MYFYVYISAVARRLAAQYGHPGFIIFNQLISARLKVQNLTVKLIKMF